MQEVLGLNPGEATDVDRGHLPATRFYIEMLANSLVYLQ